MPESESGFWFVVKNYPGIVREGLRLTTDGPTIPELRVNPDSESRPHRGGLRRPIQLVTDAVSEAAVPTPDPRIRSVRLQWLDRRYKPVWRDTSIDIDVAARRLRNIAGWLLGRRHEGSGAIGVFIFASPALAVLSPYILSRNALWRARERKEGMSRHAIVIIERLKGQLDGETEELLREALKNEWTHDRKMARRVDLSEARDALTECEMLVQKFGTPTCRPHGEARYWTDADGDLIASCEFEVGDPNPTRLKILGSTFEGEEARTLLDVCLTRKDEDESPEK